MVATFSENPVRDVNGFGPGAYWVFFFSAFTERLRVDAPISEIGGDASAAKAIMSLRRLRNATTISRNDAPYFERVRYWEDKQQMLLVALEDLNRLAKDYFKARDTAPAYELDPRISLPDPRPGLRLAMTVEAICSCIYATTEIAANFSNHLTAAGRSEGQLPGSFNKLKSAVRAGKFPVLANALGDLRWHDTLHAMRTEWGHFSTIFIGEDKNHPVVCGAELRAPSDKKVLTSKFQFRLDAVHAFAVTSLECMERFAEYLVPLVIAKFNLSEELTMPVFDANGAMVFTEDRRVKLRKITVRAYLDERGLGDVCAKLDSGTGA